MAGLEKLVAGSPFITTGPATTTTCDLTRVRLVANGAPCVVTLFNSDGAGHPAAPADIITLDAAVAAPDEYVAAADRKLHFENGCSIAMTGAGKLYLYFT